MPALTLAMDPEVRDQIRLKTAKLKCMAKQAFVPSPRTQGAVEQQSQQSGQPPQQGPNAQAVGASGITLDEVAQMIDQFYQENVGQFQQVQQQIVGLQQQINASGEDGEKGKGSGDGNLESRLAQLEMMLGGTGAVAAAGGAPAAAPPAGGAVPVPAQPGMAPPPAQQQPPGAGMAPMPGAAPA